MSLLLGIDEGTSAVKAILFDADLRPLREARREKPLQHPRPGWVEQDPEDVVTAVVEAVAEVLDDAPGEVVACGLDHQGESVLAWDAETGRALTPVVTWQDKRSQEVLDRLEQAGTADRILKLSGLPLDPYFSAGKLAWLLEHDADGGARPRGRDTADGHGGLVPVAIASARVSAPIRRQPRERSSGRRSGTPTCSRSSAYRARCSPRSPTPPATWARYGTRPGPASCRCARGARTSRPRSQEPAASSRAAPRPRTARACSCSPMSARTGRPVRAGSFRPSPGGSTERSSGRWTAACSPPGPCSSGCRATSGSRPTRRPCGLADRGRGCRRGARAAGARGARSAVVAARPRGRLSPG